MANTIIIKENGQVINSVEHVDYAVVIHDFGGNRESYTPDGERIEEADAPPTIQLRAVRESKESDGGYAKDVIIAKFYELEEACDALHALFWNIKTGEETFDVREHNSRLSIFTTP